MIGYWCVNLSIFFQDMRPVLTLHSHISIGCEIFGCFPLLGVRMPRGTSMLILTKYFKVMTKAFLLKAQIDEGLWRRMSSSFDLTSNVKTRNSLCYASSYLQFLSLLHYDIISVMFVYWQRCTYFLIVSDAGETLKRYWNSLSVYL